MSRLVEKIVEIWEDADSAVVAIIVILGVTILALGIAFGMFCLKAWVVMLLWNWAIVSLFNAPVLSFWVSFGVCLLASILLKTTVTIGKGREE